MRITNILAHLELAIGFVLQNRRARSVPIKCLHDLIVDLQRLIAADGAASTSPLFNRLSPPTRPTVEIGRRLPSKLRVVSLQTEVLTAVFFT
jgi:hypothetical protein